MIRTRWMAYQKEDHAKIAAVMDDGECLPTILLYGEAEPNEFCNHLRGMANKWIELTYIADEYEKAINSEPTSEAETVLTRY